MRSKAWISVAVLLATSASADVPRKPNAEKPEKHKFSGLKLKGQLKKPELSYIYKRNGLRAEKIVDIPENFNEEIIQDASRF